MSSNKLPSTPPQSKEDFDAAGGHTANTRMEINTGGSGSYTIGPDGKPAVKLQTYAQETTKAVDPQFVTINGMTTSRTVYEHLMRTDALPPGARVIDYHPERSAEVSGPFVEGGEGADLSAETERSTAENPKADPAVEAVFAKGQVALDTARQQLGEPAVNASIQDAVISGEATPPPGASQGQVDAVVAAYTASAIEMLADSGVSVGDLSIMLDEGELRDARRAVVSGDADRVRMLAHDTVDRLASLPTKDPSGFEVYINHRFPDLEWETKNGRALVRVEGRGMVPWDNIVRGGYLSRAKVVPMTEGDQ